MKRKYEGVSEEAIWREYARLQQEKHRALMHMEELKLELVQRKYGEKFNDG